WGWLRWGWWPGFTLPIGLALLEVVLSRQPFGGVVWGSLSVPLAQTLLAHHLAPWVGAPGLVLLLGAGNAAWALAWTRPGRGAPLFLAAALTLVATWPPSTAQSAHDSQVSGGKPPFRVLLVPGNIPQAEMEAHRDSQEIPRRYLAATLATLTTLAPLPGGPPPLVIWPEGAGNGNALKGKVLAELSRTFTLMEADLLLGADAVDRPALYNSLFLLPSGPFDFSRYDKRHLVPFGEYVPQGFRWLFGRKITAGEVDYTSGSRDPVLVWRGVSLGMGVCFESLLPGHIRTAVLGGAQALVITANNAWLDAPGQRQHLLLSLLRALEAGRDMVFVSNGGPSALIRPGMPLQSYPADSKPQTVWVQPRTHLTVYQRWGDWVLLPLVSGMVMVLAWGKKNRAKWL
ncbi:MAG: apolipoprotein N-acyltransferase, partial [Deltaproteobacteria bacterium]|nr:apolipoprotein N-acyltransferase [Deltaproteobacteria bacterium]